MLAELGETNESGQLVGCFVLGLAFGREGEGGVVLWDCAEYGGGFAVHVFLDGVEGPCFQRFEGVFVGYSRDVDELKEIGMW